MIKEEKDKYKNMIWLYISSFGVMFAILSFFNEIGLYKNNPKYLKGVLTLITGSILYYFLHIL